MTVTVTNRSPVQLDKFLEHDYVRVVRTVALACGDVGLAEDAVQNALAAALDADRRGKVIDNLAGWVVTVAINSNRRRFRRSATEVRSLAKLAPLQRDANSTVDDRVLDLRIALLGLPFRQRQVVVLHYLHDLDIATVAALVGVRSGTVKTALSRARHSLARALEPDSSTMEERHA